MVKEKAKTIRFWYGIFLSVYSVLVGVLFIVQTWSIYNAAPQSPYTVERIAEHFRQIAIPVWLWVAAVLGNIPLAIAFPEEKKRPKVYVEMTYALSKTRNSLASRGELSPKAVAKGKAEAKYRLTVRLLGGAILLLSAVLGVLILFGVCYQPLIKTAFFTAHDGVVDKLFQCVLLSVVGLGAACVVAWLTANSRKRERIFYLQEMTKNPYIRQSKKGAVETPEKQENNKTRGVWLYRTVLLAVGILLFVIGICNGGMQEVFLKAINICTQCIGLG